MKNNHRPYVRRSGSLRISGSVPQMVGGTGSILPSLQDAWGYLWFVCGNLTGAPDIAFGYEDGWMCSDLRKLGPIGFMNKYVMDTVSREDRWFWEYAFGKNFEKKLLAMRADRMGYELSSAAARINRGVIDPFGRLVFGLARADVGFSVLSTNEHFPDDHREDVYMFWQDALTELGPRNGPALLTEQMLQRMEDLMDSDWDAVEQLSELISQGVFDRWLDEGFDEQPAPIDLQKYGMKETYSGRAEPMLEPLRGLMRAIYLSDPPWMLHRAVIKYVRGAAGILVGSDVFPNHLERGVARSCRGRRG
jgi:hypothetical protein